MPSLSSALATLDAPRHKAEFYRMWLAGYHAGLEHPLTLASMGPIARSPLVEAIRHHLLAGTTQRQGIAGLVRARRGLFAPFEAALLVLGDESGTLEQCLRLLADYWAGEHRMMLRVRQRLTYPIIQMFAAAVIAPLPLVFAGAAPAYLLTAAGGVALVAAAGGSVLLAAARRYGRQPGFVRARLLRGITIAIEAGLPLAPAVELAAAASDDSAIIAHLAGIPLRTIAAQPLARTFAGCPGIPREMVAAMEVADATGDYGGTLQKLADLYEG
jgi:type II secretory pathway component PulF